MNDFSSFKKQKLLVENWRNFNNKNQIEEQQINEVIGFSFLASLARSSGNFAKILSAISNKLNIPALSDIAKMLSTIHEKFIEVEKEHPKLMKLITVGDFAGTIKGKSIEAIVQAIADKLSTEEEPEELELDDEPISESIYDNAVLEDGTLVCAGCLQEHLESQRTILQEAKYQGRSVTLNKPMKGDVKKFKVYVKDPSTGNVKKVNFGDPNMRIKKSNPARRKSFRARHNCANPGPKTKARYWSCRKW